MCPKFLFLSIYLGKQKTCPCFHKEYRDEVNGITHVSVIFRNEINETKD